MLAADGSTETYLVSCADEALNLIKEKPQGVGVDAPLWWSSGRSSDRQADQWIRKKYKIQSGTVQTANSLRGAALVQGAIFVDRLRERFPGAPVTEAHPKALLIAMKIEKWVDFARRFSVHAGQMSEHERDAVIAAVAAREGFEGRWSTDLAENRNPSEQDPSSYWLSPINYFWPA